MPSAIDSKDQIILFDGVCKLCNAWIKFIIKYDKEKQFKLCSVQSSQGKTLLKRYGLPTDHYETMVLVKNKKAYQKSSAFLKVIQQISYPWKALMIFKVIPEKLRDWLYDRIALNRYKLFGRYDHCQIPSAEHSERFIDDK
ncbi:thiol-disulfide oxidoreductase DCC family protein [Pleionea mediterranea]|uniref:Putative DCC family thiol-disulfide oxidoreductase YuxK n=1 Tax=Pleionea mediterranea TaxID=523701 RepID=A0A316FWI3_9GAMM|nr:thiol-disulfide oxidoreductase DCC family protein [Pleionea mediterranea]PWK46417.1 putative DCC family thiol-disulfide oxidoreductase YuxK [Pleionea mediterranea]